MKKILLITILLFGLHSYAQKRLEIHNFSPFTIRINNITTTESGTYPIFSASGGSLLVLAPGASYVLENATSLTRFPFHSPASVPYISTWVRRTSPTTPTALTSPVAWAMGDLQVFGGLAFQIDKSGTIIGDDVVSVINPSITTTDWSVTYSQFTIGTAITYTVVFTL